MEIKVVNAVKSYGANKVIDGLHMSVPSGTIYGLLGASGCGKSTLLQCILGTISLDSGTIDLKANYLRDVGYMPQDLCLEHTLTIKEMFEYYGTLYNMTKKQIDGRVDELTRFLQLPDTNKYIKNISGGQGRRVSLAVSILHDPQVIILDEPTVGIDPLLRQEIWKEFSRMVENNKKTIIITTHYIEEASKANFVGLMRNGMLIEEGSPQYILNKYETDSLESAFLTLCCKRERNIRNVQDDVPDTQVREGAQAYSKYLKKSGKTTDITRIKALLKKNYNVFSRDYLLLFTVIVLPIFQIFNLCIGVGMEVKNLEIAIKSEEIKFSECQYFKFNGCIFDEGYNQTLSCIILNYLAAHTYKLVEVEDRNSGDYRIKYHNTLAFLYFPKNYSEDVNNYVGGNRTSYNFQSPMYVNIAKDNVLLKHQFVRDLTDSLQNVLETTLTGCSNNRKALNLPMEFNTAIGKDVKSILNSMIGLFVAMGAFYYPSLFSVSLMLSERMDGILGRSMFGGVTILELLISLFIIITFLFTIQMAVPIFVAYVLFPNPILITNGLFMYSIVMVLLGWIGFLWGLVVAGLSTTKLGGVYVINGLTMSQFLLSGFLWPIEGQSPYVRLISEMLPIRIAGNTMNEIALKGWTWNHPSVLFGTSLTAIQVIVLVLVLFVLGKIKKDMWVLNK